MDVNCPQQFLLTREAKVESVDHLRDKSIKTIVNTANILQKL